MDLEIAFGVARQTAMIFMLYTWIRYLIRRFYQKIYGFQILLSLIHSLLHILGLRKKSKNIFIKSI